MDYSDDHYRFLTETETDYAPQPNDPLARTGDHAMTVKNQDATTSDGTTTATLGMLAHLDALLKEAPHIQVVQATPKGKVLRVSSLTEADVETAGNFLIGKIKQCMGQ